MELEKLSIRELISRLKVGQFWGLLVIIFGLITGAFGLGYKTSSVVNEARLNTAQSQITELKTTVNTKESDLSKVTSKLSQLNEKDRFFSLYLRYMIAKEEWGSDYGVDSARKAFDEYLQKRIDADKLIIKKPKNRST
ncbi:MAG: hypothetical protein KAS19_03120 [Anaerolineales bacterium]|jgi:hypothetical protein|nr:hypothetical protein [Anaerolineales bacterium]